MSELGGKWSEVGQRIEELTRKVKHHFEQTGHAEQAAEPLDRIRESVSGAFEAAGNAVHDDTVRADVRETGRLFLDALSASFAVAAEHLREPAPMHDARPEAPTSIDDKPAQE